MTCSIVTVDPQLTAVVRAKVSFPDPPKAQRAARTAVDAALPSLDAGPLGRPVTRFRTPAHERARHGDRHHRRPQLRRPRARSCRRTCRPAAPRTSSSRGRSTACRAPGRRCSTGARPRSSSSPASTGKSTCPGRASIPPSSRRISTRWRDLHRRLPAGSCMRPSRGKRSGK